MARYSTAEALQKILQEDKDSDEDNASEVTASEKPADKKSRYRDLKTTSEKPADKKRTQGRCHLCLREIDKKTHKLCDNCSRPARSAHCLNRSNVLCDNCSKPACPAHCVNRSNVLCDKCIYTM